MRTQVNVKTVLLLLLFWLLVPEGRTQVVNTRFGPVKGTSTGSVYQFLGIPFARPPVDSLRWRAPVDPVAWTGVLDALDYAPVCPQKVFEQGSDEYTFEGEEDCLRLNIWTPLSLPGNLPVMVFIHGGGNQQGGAGEVRSGTHIYSGRNLAERGQVVVVTIQYRLGPLGYLVHPGLEPENQSGKSGNYAVLDQILALKWIRSNISAFGGDTTRVMLFGESAGGVNVGNLLASPLATGLFQRACIQSASPVINDYQDSRAKGIDYVNRFGGAGTDIQKISKLRQLPADSLVASLTSPLEGGKVQMNWQPVLDGAVFTNFPILAIQSGQYNKVQLMTGSNAEEMSLSAPATVLPQMVTALINLYVPAALRQTALRLYPPGINAAEARKSYVAILTDVQFTATARRTAGCISRNQEEQVWRYFFTHKHTNPLMASLGSYHGMELFYVFNNWENAAAGSGLLFKPEDDSVQRVMLNYWVNFAATGNPNGNGLANWPPYHSSTDCYLDIKARPDGSLCGLRTEESDLWDRVAGFSGCSAANVDTYQEAQSELLVYPNPSSGIVNFFMAGRKEGLNAQLCDLSGRVILSLRNQNQADLSFLSPGIYLLKVINHQEVSCRKIILE
jgi:para-nitrobenzyl esterase